MSAQMDCWSSAESLRLAVKIVAMLNFIFWSLLLILYGFIFFEAVKIVGTPSSNGEDKFLGELLYFGEDQDNVSIKGSSDYKPMEEDEIAFSAALLTNFVVIIIFQIFLSLLLLHASEKKKLVRLQVWFYVSFLIFGIDIVSHIVAFVMGGMHIFILSKTILLAYFAFCLLVVYCYIQRLKKEIATEMPNRNGSLSPPVLLVTPVIGGSHCYNCNQAVASFPEKTGPIFPKLIIPVK
ncbi:unnamed protein product [Allacma fusca]|uniref:Uncharacterized protein n=1 Tax=Allacma fusca TaxID=39272 RepID=A0A8J2M918_9HEXA|nr:unnamed protein product [Allacma fusca]